ncbi:MAG: hypothetical protein QWI73_05585 [Alphaproteobacteria bacterium]|nr:hypothetical protein [Alphaproteobacteria bacterium]
MLPSLEENTGSKDCGCPGKLEVAMKRLEDQLKQTTKRTEEILRLREEREEQITLRLVEAVTEHLNKNLASLLEGTINSLLEGAIGPLLEGAIQRDIKSQLIPRLEKAITQKIDQKTGEIQGQTSVLAKTLRSSVIDHLVPILENGMTEIRIQMLEQMKESLIETPKIPEEKEDPSTECSREREEALDNLADVLKKESTSLEFAASNMSLETDPYDTIAHLLETNIKECFNYVINSGDPDVFLFLLEHIPLDAEMDIPSPLLVSFAVQLITVTEMGKRYVSPQERIRHVLLLNNTLGHLERNKLPAALLRKLEEGSRPLIQNPVLFGITQEEKETIQVLSRLLKAPSPVIG